MRVGRLQEEWVPAPGRPRERVDVAHESAERRPVPWLRDDGPGVVPGTAVIGHL